MDNQLLLMLYLELMIFNFFGYGLEISWFELIPAGKKLYTAKPEKYY